MTWTRRRFLQSTLASVALATFPWTLTRGQEPITIGHQVDLTGALPEYGYWHDKVVGAAVETINEAGGIDGREIRRLREDTATDAGQGRDRMVKMAESGADLIIGSQHSGVSVASLPLAPELDVVYFPMGEATEITGESGNRHIVHVNHAVKSHAQVAHPWAVENLGAKWTIVVADYSFGRSHAGAWPPLLQDAGAEVLETITVPLETSDFVPFLSQVPDETDVLFHVFPGANALRFLRAADGLGLLADRGVFGVIGTVEGIDLMGLPALQDSFFISNHPRRLDQVPESIRPFDAAFREAVGVDENGREIGSDRVITGSHYWYGWEILYLLKQAIEETGWRDGRDNADLIRFLEGHEVSASENFFQGDLRIRAADHQGFHAHYIERLGPNGLEVVERFEPGRSVYPATVDYREGPSS
ncbi:MAG: ABC transporter substrate-binding protein [Candidatus Bipolaricaulia bacterium]